MSSSEDLDTIAADCETVRVEYDGDRHGVATVTIDRPDARNALNAQVRSELKTIAKAVEGSEVGVIVITGAEEAKAFVAGADVTELRNRDGTEQREISERPRVYEAIADLPQPVIAAINGHALGGGCELAQACDIRIAHERAKLGQPEINLGIIPGGGGTQRLPRLIGEGQAMKLILSGELIDAEEGLELDLVDEVHGEEFEERVYELADSISRKSPYAVRTAKRAIKASQRMGLEDGIEYEVELFTRLFDLPDKDEGIDAFLEDREPEWTAVPPSWDR